MWRPTFTIQIKIGDLGILKHFIGAALGALSTGLNDNKEDNEEAQNTPIYKAKIEILKIVNPTKGIELCDDTIGSKIPNKEKVKFAKEKVNIIQSLGMGLKYLKEAKNEYSSLASSSISEKQPCDIFKCGICDGCFTTKRNLNNHISIMHRCQEKCDKCSELFSDKAALEVHSKKCEWLCQYCNYKSLKKSNLQRHTKTVHADKTVSLP